MHFQVKNILKNNHNYTLKQAEKQIRSAKKKMTIVYKIICPQLWLAKHHDLW
jgi:hypothetical protein